MSYPVPSGIARNEIIIKKSRFIAYAGPVADRTQAMQWLADIKQGYPDARHHCWAYLIGNPSCASNAGMGDDGEPSGTAGKPILNVLSHKGIGDIMIIVVRYFGGIKLGAGGLTRAYSQAAQAVMDELPSEQQIPMQNLQIIADFSQEHALRHRVQEVNGHIQHIDYEENIIVHIQIPEQHINDFTQSINALQCRLKHPSKP